MKPPNGETRGFSSVHLVFSWVLYGSEQHWMTAEETRDGSQLSTREIGSQNSDLNDNMPLSTNATSITTAEADNEERVQEHDTIGQTAADSAISMISKNEAQYPVRVIEVIKKEGRHCVPKS